MRNKMKKAIPLAIFLFILVFAIGQARADFSAFNINTGYNSENESEAESKNEFEIINENQQIIVNLAGGSGSTGDNSANENTGDGSAESGHLDVVAEFESEVNLSEIIKSGEWLSDFTAINDTTGADSDNEAEAELSNETKIKTVNEVELDNLVEVEAKTGGNEADENTGSGDVTSGDITGMIGLANRANGVLVDMSDELLSMSFSVIAMNDTTGADSDNEASVDIDNEVDVNNENTADIVNDVYFEAKTGKNSASENTGDGEVNSGDADATIDILNDINMAHNIIDVGAGPGEINAFNFQTGADSDNEAEAEIDNEVDVDNDNFSEIANMVAIELKTGKNEADENTGDGEVTSGDASAEVAIINGSEDNGNLTEITIDLDSLDVTLGNCTTGADSDNEASFEFDNEIKVENENETNIANMVELEIKTGHNSANENTGSGSVESGDAEGEVRIENQVNANTTSLNFSPSADISLMNSNTGADSDNEAKAEIKNEVKIENKNSVEIVNDVSMELKTGNNSANENTGSGSVSSGNASMVFGIINTTNGNVIQAGE